MASGAGKKLVLVIVSMALIYGCAKVSTPTGGPRDLMPPVMLKMVPADGTVLFTGKEFTVTFDEYFILEKVDEKFMVSPPMDKKPEIVIKGKELIVKLTSEMKENTTYTFYFQDAIRDNNERNPINNFQFVVSTGSYVDSLSVTGNAYIANNLEPAAGYLVLMYSNLTDTAVYKMLPDYITRTDAAGNYRINNVKPGVYNIYALEDANGNKKYNFPEEGFGFLSGPIEISEEKNWLPVVADTVVIRPTLQKTQAPAVAKEIKGEYPIYTFKALQTRQYMKASERKSAGQLLFAFNLPLDSGQFEIRSVEGEFPQSVRYDSKGADTIIFWMKDSIDYQKAEHSFIVSYPFTDTTSTLVTNSDTILMRFIEPRRPVAAREKEKLDISFNARGREISPAHKLAFVGKVPLVITDPSLLKIWETKDSTRKLINNALVADTTDPRRVGLEVSLQEKKSYQIMMEPGAVADIYGLANDTISVVVNVRSEEDYGRVKAVISSSPGRLIVQLLDSQERVVAEQIIDGDETADFRLVERGKYRIRAVHDIDGNGKWSTGNPKTGVLPEPVTYYPEELDVKINWEIQQEWDVSQFYFKKAEMKTIKKQ